jgi:hypothetical protein
MKLTDMLEKVTKEHNFFLLSAEDNVLLTMSDEPIYVPQAKKQLVHCLYTICGRGRTRQQQLVIMGRHRPLKIVPSNYYRVCWSSQTCTSLQLVQ